MVRFDGQTIYPGVPDCTWVQDDSITWFYRYGPLDCLVTFIYYRQAWDWTVQQGYGQGNVIISGHNITEGNGYKTADDAKTALENWLHKALVDAMRDFDAS